jgi:competence protein ComEC
MLPRPAWLALGVVAAAGAGAGAAATGTARSGTAAMMVAAAVAAGLVVAALACEAAHRPKLASGLAVATLGAAVIVARLAVSAATGGATTGGTAPPPLPAGSGTWQATVASSHVTKAMQIATLRLADTPLTCSAQLPAYPQLIAGDAIRWSGRFRSLTGSDYDQWLASQGIAARCEATDLSLVGHDSSPAGALEGFRQASGDALQRVVPEPEGGLAAAILIGLRDRVDKDVATDFTTAGVSHIVAISGWNIAIVAATVAAVLGGMSGIFSRRRRALVTIAAIVAYTLFAGATPSVVRAAVMAGVALLAIESGRGSRATVGLAWAIALMIAVEPGAVGDVGFQLSAAATAGLVAWARPLTSRLERSAPWIPGPIRSSLGVSLAAQAATLPIALLAFGRLALIAPVANLLAVPLVPPAMAAGALAFGAGWMATLGAPIWLSGLLAMPAWALLAGLIWVVHLMAAVPGANETLAFPANAVAAAVACSLLSGLHAMLRRPAPAQPARPSRRSGIDAMRQGKPARPKHRAAFALAALVVALAGCVVASRPDGAIHVVVLDVGQGDAILLEGDRGGRILVDGGPDGDLLLRALDRYVPAWDRRLDAIVLTHPHDDHVGGLTAVADKYRVGRAFDSGWPSTTPLYRAWLDALSAQGVQPERLRTGDEIRLDDATLRVLWPDDGTVRPSNLDPTATDNRKTNDSSIVLLGEYEDRRFLLTGDAEDDVDPVLLARGLPTVDMLKVPHHGSATASSNPLLAALSPAVAVVSVGAANPYGHPAPATIGRLRAHARIVLRTDQVGSVETTLDAAAVTVSSGRVPEGAATSRAGTVTLPVGTVTSSRAGLLYDSFDVRPEPSRERGIAAFAGAPALATAPLVRRGGDRCLAGVASRDGRKVARSPPRRSGRSPP